MKSDRPTVFVVDDEIAVQEALITLVGSRGHRAESFASAEDFLARYDRDTPGCLVADQRLNGLSGTELLRILQSEGGHLPVILMTAFATVPLAVQVMELGALTVLEKPCHCDELWQCIDRALQIDSSIHAARVRGNDARRRIDALLHEERTVLDCIIAGKQNKVIAHELSIGLRTVEARRQSIFQKLGAQSLAELLRKVFDARTPIDQSAQRLFGVGRLGSPQSRS